MRVAVAMPVPVKSMRCAAEAAIGRAAIRLAVQSRHCRKPGTAVASPHQTHRHGAGGRSTHHGQNDTARAFHVAASVFEGLIRTAGSLHHFKPTRQAKADRFTGSCGTKPVAQPPTEKCDAKARANEPNPPRVTLPEAESDEVADGERFDEESPPKKLLRDDHPPDQPRPLPDPLGGHSALGCKSDAIPGRLGPQFWLGISA
jgi:hypothetical protein